MRADGVAIVIEISVRRNDDEGDDGVGRGWVVPANIRDESLASKVETGWKRAWRGG